jgi:hypothetical protein
VTPSQLTSSVDLSNVWIEPMAVVAQLAGSTAWSGQLQFSSVPRSGDVYVRLQYVNGYPNTTLAAAMSVNATAMQVADATGILPSSRITIYDGLNSETFTVSATWTHTTGPATVTLATGCAFAHSTAGVAVSAMPPAIKQACIFFTSALLKARGNAALVMGSVTPAQFQAANPSAAQDVVAGRDLLAPFRRLR